MTENKRIERRLPVKARRILEVNDSSADSSDAKQPFIGFLFVIWQRRFFVLACLILAFAGGIVSLVNATKLYQGTSTVYVQRSLPKMLEEQMSNNGQSAGYLFTQCQVIQSTAILTTALEFPEMSQVKSLQGVGNPLGFLKSVVVALPDRQGDLINVSATTINAEDSAIIANAVVQAYIEYLGSQHKSTSVEVINILQKEMDRREKELRSARDAMVKMRQENPTLAFDSVKDSIANSQLSDKISGYSNAQVRVLDLQTAAAEAKPLRDPVAIKLILQQYQIPFENAGDTSQVATQYFQLQREIRDLQDHFGPSHPAMQADLRDLSELRLQLAAMTDQAGQAYKDAIDSATVAANAKLQQFQNQILEYQKTAVDSNVKQAQYAQLAQEVDRDARSLDSLDTRMKEVGIGEDAGAMSISVLETAKPNFYPVSPRTNKVLGLALVAGLLAGFGGAMLLDSLDQKLHSADDINAALEVTILGVIPKMVGRTSQTDRAQEVHLRPRSSVAEAYRAVRTAIVFNNAELGSVKTILFTSPTMGEGKSTTIANVAIAFANANRRVLLIDADCRRPSIARLFKLNDGPGLSNILVGQNTVSEVVQKLSIENLEILPSGPIPANPVELLDSAAFIELLNTVSGNYDHILIDSPPVMPVTDARVIAAACDATIMVVRGARATRRLVRYTRDTISSMGGNLIGIIANDLSRGIHGYQYVGYRYKENSAKSRETHVPKKLTHPIVARSLPMAHASANGTNGQD